MDRNEIKERIANWFGCTMKRNRPKGKWIDHQAGWSECTNCGERFSLMNRANKRNYCGNCGAEMETEEE